METCIADSASFFPPQLSPFDMLTRFTYRATTMRAPTRRRRSGALPCRQGVVRRARHRVRLGRAGSQGRRLGSGSILTIATLVCVFCVFPGAVEVSAQDLPFLPEPATQELQGEGWAGFTDLPFLGNLLLSLVLATVLAALIAYHPKYRRQMESIEAAEMPKIFIMYAVVGSIIGTMVLKYGIVVGLVVFGIGGLIRFRTNLGSATRTGRLIFVTVIGLCSGLDLPHVAVISTGFGFGLIYLFEGRVTYRIEVKGLKSASVKDAADFYRSTIEQEGCRILSEAKDFNKGNVAFVFRAPPATGREDLEYLFEVDVPEESRGTVDWERA